MCIYTYIYIYISLKFASRFAVFGASPVSDASGLRALPGSKCRYLLHLAAFGRSSLAGAADRPKWLLEPAPEPEISRNGRSSPPRSRRILGKCRSSLPRSRRMLDGCRSSLARNRKMRDGCRSSHPGGAECSTGAARACPGAAACSKSAVRAHSREVRSFLAFEMAARKVLPPVRLLSASAFARLHFASCMLCTGSH